MPNISVNIDADGIARAAALLPVVQLTVPLADLAYVYNGAAGVGLNRICSTMPTRVLDGADLTPAASSGVVLTTFDLDAEKTSRASAKAASVGLLTQPLISAAVATGLALLSGDDPGPFTIDGVSRQFLPPVIP